jgi:hypothetical protein
LGKVGSDDDWNLELEYRNQNDTFIKPAIRSAHLNPILGLLRRWLINIGQTTPPMEEPEYIIPMAIARLRLNQWLMQATDGKKLKSELVENLIHRRNRDSECYTLRQEKLPVALTLGNDKEAKDEKTRSSQKKPPWSMRVKNSSSKESATEHTEDLKVS